MFDKVFAQWCYCRRSVWLPSMYEIQAYAYFRDDLEDATNYEVTINLLTLLLSQEERCPQRQHLLKYYSFWRKSENIGSIDELVLAVDNQEIWP